MAEDRDLTQEEIERIADAADGTVRDKTFEEIVAEIEEEEDSHE